MLYSWSKLPPFLLQHHHPLFGGRKEIMTHPPTSVNVLSPPAVIGLSVRKTSPVEMLPCGMVRDLSSWDQDVVNGWELGTRLTTPLIRGAQASRVAGAHRSLPALADV